LGSVSLVTVSFFSVSRFFFDFRHVYKINIPLGIKVRNTITRMKKKAPVISIFNKEEDGTEIYVLEKIKQEKTQMRCISEET
jgi:hypothetical protein